MTAVVFESEQYVTQDDFRACLRRNGRASGDDPSKYELLNGRIVISPPVDDPMGKIEAAVVARIQVYVRDHDLGDVYSPSQWIDLPSGDTVAPDTSYFAKGRIPPPEDPKATRKLRIVPDLVVEVLSPSSERRDRGEKKGIYERNGVREYWIVDWRKRLVLLFSLDAAGRYDTGTEFGEEDVVESKVLPGLHLAVRTILAG